MGQGKTIDNMTFEEAFKELEEIVNKIDNGNQDLETAITSFERGHLLRKQCEKKLSEAQLKIDKITKNEQTGEISFDEIKL